LEKSLDDGTLREKINVGLYHVAAAGRQAGGATPRVNFQVFVTSYMTFFNEDDPECNSISGAFGGGLPPNLARNFANSSIG
jgi:hypothetical protein